MKRIKGRRVYILWCGARKRGETKTDRSCGGNSAATTTGSPPFLAPSSMGTWSSLLLETSLLLCGPSPETKTMAIRRNVSQVMVTSYKMLPSLPIGSLLYQYQGAGMESFICGISTPVPQTADSLDTLKTFWALPSLQTIVRSFPCWGIDSSSFGTLSATTTILSKMEMHTSAGYHVLILTCYCESYHGFWFLGQICGVEP